MNIPFTQAKSISYGGTRSYSSIYYIIIHYTGISGDTAENEVKYFATGNTRSAGAHFFVGQDGHICQSIKMKNIAYSVPRKRQGYSGGGTYLGKCTNANSISIELCDNLTKDPSTAQTEAVRQLVAYIQSICPNAQTIIRHYDVTGKLCPARMTGDAKWHKFKMAITAKNDTTVKGDDALTDNDYKQVQQMIDTAIRKALKGEGTNPSTWAEAEMNEAVALGITDGTRPQGYSTREETAVMALRSMKAGGGDVD